MAVPGLISLMRTVPAAVPLLFQSSKSVCILFTVLLAADGETGLELVRAYGDTLNCVLLDLSMPRLSGEQVLPAIRELRPALPVVVMSGYDTEELRARFADAAAVAFLQKPFRPQELYAAVELALQG